MLQVYIYCDIARYFLMGTYVSTLVHAKNNFKCFICPCIWTTHLIPPQLMQTCLPSKKIECWIYLWPSSISQKMNVECQYRSLNSGPVRPLVCSDTIFTQSDITNSNRHLLLIPLPSALSVWFEGQRDCHSCISISCTTATDGLGPNSYTGIYICA